MTKQNHIRLLFLSSPAESRETFKFCLSFILGIKWKLRICVMPRALWHPWAFCDIQDGVQNGHWFTVLRPTQEFFTYMETSPLPVRGCKNLAYARGSGPLSREGSISCHNCCDTGPRFSGLIGRTAPFSRLDVFWLSGFGEEDFKMTPPKFCMFVIISPFEEELALYLNNFESPLPKDDFYQVWLKLACLFWRRFFFPI
jgi:hypothetical protein